MLKHEEVRTHLQGAYSVVVHADLLLLQLCVFVRVCMYLGARLLFTCPNKHYCAFRQC
jgi:hypothetical protein